MSTKQEIKIATILATHVLPAYKRAVAENYSFAQLDNRYLKNGICNYIFVNFPIYYLLIRRFFNSYLKNSTSIFLFNPPVFYYFNTIGVPRSNFMLGITDRITWMENFIATHTPNLVSK